MVRNILFVFFSFTYRKPFYWKKKRIYQKLWEQIQQTNLYINVDLRLRLLSWNCFAAVSKGQPEIYSNLCSWTRSFTVRTIRVSSPSAVDEMQRSDHRRPLTCDTAFAKTMPRKIAWIKMRTSFSNFVRIYFSFYSNNNTSHRSFIEMVKLKPFFWNKNIQSWSRTIHSEWINYLWMIIITMRTEKQRIHSWIWILLSTAR